MYTRDRGQCHIEYYDSIQDFLRTQDSRDYTFHAETRRNNNDKSFYGVKSYDEAVDLLTGGYSKPVKIMDGVKCTDSAEAQRPRFHNAVVGGAVCVPLAIAGVPTCMIQREPLPTRNRIIKFVVDVGRGGGVSTRSIEAWGKKIVALIRAIEATGRRVQLDAMGTVCEWNGGKNYAFRIPIKKAAEPLDIKRICFPLLHAAFQRVFKFDWYDRLPDSPDNWGYSSATCYHMNDRNQYSTYIAPLLETGERLINFTTDFDELKKSL